MDEFLVKRYKDDGVKFVKITVVGYSLGGLIARYTVGILFDRGFFNNVDPITFATFATPHLGSKFHGDGVHIGALNFLGSNFLGVSGNDMFGYNSTILQETANPKSCFYKALQKFKHLQLFANAVHDRTVPFFTAFISDVDPFQKRDFVDFVYYQTPSMSKRKKEVDEKLFVDMDNSRYRESSNGIDVYPSTQERKFQALALFTLPWVFPIVFTLTSFTTVMSRYRVKEAEKAMESNESTLIKRKSRSEGIADLAYYTIDEVFLEGAIDTFEPAEVTTTPHAKERTTQGGNSTDDEESSNILLAETKNSSPTDAPEHDGYEGLIASTPTTLELNKETETWIHNLNQLPWKKYVVKLRRMHSHAEIVNRRNASGQGQVVLDFWTDLMAQYIKENDQ